MSLGSLEAERQAILARMQTRRENYRRMLTDGVDVVHDPVHRNGGAVTAYSHSPPVPDAFPRSPLMRVISEHPFLCALGVAAVVAIGPRRIARSVTTGGAAIGALTARNRSNIDMIGQLLSMVGAYARSRGSKRPPR